MDPSPQQKDGTHMPVINLKVLNKFIKRQHFKMEGLQLIKDLLQKGDWMVMVDLNDAHLSIPITAAQWNLLRFKWHNQTYEFLCLSFKVQQCSMSVDFFQFILKPSN